MDHPTAVTAAAKPSRKMTCAIFSGGTGSNRLTQSLLRVGEPQLSLKLIVNAYDDGKSTGRIRRDFGMLGPSDIAKNMMATLDPNQPGASEILSFLELTLAEREGVATMIAVVERIAAGQPTRSTELENRLDRLPVTVKEAFRDYLRFFVDQARAVAQPYDLDDFRLRNLIFTGAFFKNERDYQATIAELSEVLQVRAEIILNNFRDLHLVATTRDGRLLANEAAVVDDSLDQDIIGHYLLAHRLGDGEAARIDALLDQDEKDALLAEAHQPLSLSDRAAEAIRSADLVVFAPTTIDSSLVPTLISDGCWAALRDACGPRIFVANLIRERGTFTLAEQLRELEKSLQQQLGASYFLHDVMDYVLVNNHGCRTNTFDGVIRIPIDRLEIERMGIEVVVADVEDHQHVGLHDGDALARQIVSLTDRHKTTLRPAKDDQAKEILRHMLLSPISQTIDREKAASLVKRLLGVEDLQQSVSAARIRVVIAANGRGSRLEGDIPKPVYPINGRPCIVHLAEKAQVLDPNFLVVTNSENDAAIRQALAQVSNREHTLVTEPRGSGAAVLATADEFAADDENIMIVWADAPNLRLSTMVETAMIHKALGDSAVTMPTTWEMDPYAGVERDADGRATGMFQTKVDPHKKRLFGEHDASLFVAKADVLFDALRHWQPLVTSHDPRAEIDLLQAINLIPERGGILTAAAIADARESKGFNTIAEARAVEANAKALSSEVIRLADFVGVSESMHELQDDDESESLSSGFKPEVVQQRFREAIKRSYQAAVFDVDGNLLDADGQLRDDVLAKLIELAGMRLPIAFITGRRNESLKTRLLDKLVATVDRSLLNGLYTYPYNGAIGYRLDGPGHRFFDRPLPSYLAAATMRILREHLLTWLDDYDVTNYKITIWPHEKSRQRQMVRSMNHLLSLAMIPVRAQISGSIEENGAIVLTSVDIHSKVGKRAALEDFSRRVGVKIDDIVKVGDQGCPDGVDHELLVGHGSFGTQFCDPASQHQIDLPILSGKRNVEAWLWLMPQLVFEPMKERANDQPTDSVHIGVSGA